MRQYDRSYKKIGSQRSVDKTSSKRFTSRWERMLAHAPLRMVEIALALRNNAVHWNISHLSFLRVIDIESYTRFPKCCPNHRETAWPSKLSVAWYAIQPCHCVTRICARVWTTVHDSLRSRLDQQCSWVRHRRMVRREEWSLGFALSVSFSTGGFQQNFPKKHA